jgi:hypothetical protein
VRRSDAALLLVRAVRERSLPWNDQARLSTCYDKYWSGLNRNVDFNSVWLPAEEAATQRMLADLGCRPDSSATAAPGTYHPMTPARLLDTRNGTGLSGKLSANTPATFAVAGQDGIPGNATAVTGNVTGRGRNECLGRLPWT